MSVAGSARRMADSVKDIDLIASRTRPVALAKRLAKLEQIESVSSASAVGARARTHSGVGVDLRIGSRGQLGNLLQHFTGSGATTRRCAKRRCAGGCTSPSTACSTTRTDGRARARASRRCTSCSASPTSSRSCARTAASWRRRGATAAKGLPELIELGDIRGDLHCHTIASDGHNTIEEMAARGAGARVRVPGDHRPLGDARLRQRRLPGPAAPPDRAGARGGRADGGHRAAGGQRGEHPARRLARLRGRAARASSTGWWRACTRRSGWASRR